MRLAALLVAITLALVTPVLGQTPPAAQGPYGFDPYAPSDATLLRGYGGTLVSQTSLAGLRQLDPYRPSDAELMRQLGGAIPLWGFWGYPWYGPCPMPPAVSPFAEPAAASLAAAGVGALVDELLRARAAPTAAPPAGVSPPSGPVATAVRPESNDGVWISYAGERWVSAGPAVPLDASFARIGDYDGVPVYRRAGAGGDVIYLPSRGDRLAPYRVKP